MARRVMTFPSAAAARSHIAVLDASERRPVCDCGGLCDGDHSGSGVRRGARISSVCICAHRDSPDMQCPYVTATTAVAIQIGDVYAVDVTEAHGRAGIDTGRAVDVSSLERVPNERVPLGRGQ